MEATTEWHRDGNVSRSAPLCSATNATTLQRRRKYKRQRPLDVNKWSCGHVAQWLGEQRWGWSELSSYQRRMCKVGVDGSALYHIDEDDLKQDIKVLSSCFLCIPNRLMLYVSLRAVKLRTRAQPLLQRMSLRCLNT